MASTCTTGGALICYRHLGHLQCLLTLGWPSQSRHHCTHICPLIGPKQDGQEPTTDAFFHTLKGIALTEGLRSHQLQPHTKEVASAPSRAYVPIASTTAGLGAPDRCARLAGSQADPSSYFSSTQRHLGWLRALYIASACTAAFPADRSSIPTRGIPFAWLDRRLINYIKGNCTQSMRCASKVVGFHRRVLAISESPAHHVTEA